MANTTNLGLGLLSAAQSQKHVTVNESFVALDTLTQTRVLDRSLTAPPGSPSEGDTYLVAPSATGAWAGQDNNLTVFYDSIWRFYTVKTGWLIYVVDEGVYLKYDGTDWISAFPSQALTWGWQNYQDTATTTTPISLTANTWTKLTNDGLGPLTDKTTYKVPTHGDIWDTASDQFDLTSLAIGDRAEFRIDFDITTTGANHFVEVRLAFGPSLVFTNAFYNNLFKTAGTYKVQEEVKLAMFNADTRDHPVEIQVRVDAGGDSIEVAGWYVETLVR